MTRRQPLAQRAPRYAPDHPLAAGRDGVAALKARGRAALFELGVTLPAIPGVPGGMQGDRLTRIGRGIEASRTPANADAPAPRLSDPTCRATFDANRKITEVYATAVVDQPVRALAAIVDPRAWGLGSGVIDTAFRVTRDANGQYNPLAEPASVEFGAAWNTEDAGGFLFEYARSDIASFENILKITTFTATDDHVRVEYHLHECLRTTFGFLSADGGLQLNDGYVDITPHPDGSHIKVLKRIRVRDLTPDDPGNRYDFGQWMNASIGASLSLWVDDTSMMSPVF